LWRRGQSTTFEVHGIRPNGESQYSYTDHCLYQSLCVDVSNGFRFAQDQRTHRETIQPLPHHLDLPQMRLLDKVWLRIDIEDSIAVPMVPASVDQIRLNLASGCGVTVRVCDAVRRCVGQSRVVADVEPDIGAPVNEGQSLTGDVQVAVFVVVGEVGSISRDRVVLSWRESPLAPLLCVRGCDGARQERWFALGLSLLVRA
jgi:hypothetical protein